jgi:hypothetical protein
MSDGLHDLDLMAEEHPMRDAATGLQPNILIVLTSLVVLFPGVSLNRGARFGDIE